MCFGFEGLGVRVLVMIGVPDRVSGACLYVLFCMVGLIKVGLKVSSTSSK